MALATFDRQELERFAREFEELFSSGDFATMASYYAEDAKIMAPDAELVRGRHAIEEFWKTSCQGAQSMGMKRTIDVQDVESSGSLGYLVSIVTLEIPTADERVATITVNDVTVWKTQADGGWRILVDSAARTTPMTTPPT